MQPQTSILAHNRFTADGKKEQHYTIILNVLDKIGQGTSKEIADRCELDYIQVSRRMPEMEGKQIVFRNGTKINTGDRTPSTIWKPLLKSA